MSNTPEHPQQIPLPSTEGLDVANTVHPRGNTVIDHIEKPDEIDRLADQGKTYGEARQILGLEIASPLVQNTIKVIPSVKRSPSKWKGPISRSKLSAGGKLLADTTEFSDKQNEWRRQ